MATPLELLDNLIDESGDLIEVETETKAAWRAVSPEDQAAAGRELYARRERDVQRWRAKDGLPQFAKRVYLPLADSALPSNAQIAKLQRQISAESKTR